MLAGGIRKSGAAQHDSMQCHNEDACWYRNNPERSVVDCEEVVTSHFGRDADVRTLCDVCIDRIDDVVGRCGACLRIMENDYITRAHLKKIDSLLALDDDAALKKLRRVCGDCHRQPVEQAPMTDDHAAAEEYHQEDFLDLFVNESEDICCPETDSATKDELNRKIRKDAAVYLHSVITAVARNIQKAEEEKDACIRERLRAIADELLHHVPSLSEIDAYNLALRLSSGYEPEMAGKRSAALLLHSLISFGK